MSEQERKVNLPAYLPPFVAEYAEMNTALTAENPEFQILWDSTARVLRNEFIVSADEYGIARFEKLLGIFPAERETLEARRERVQARWFLMLPYTWRMLLEKLIQICGENRFTIRKEFDFYRIDLEVQAERYGQVADVERLLMQMLPCNIVLTVRNRIPCEVQGGLALSGSAAALERFFITNDSNETYAAITPFAIGTGISMGGSALLSAGDVELSKFATERK